MRILIATTLVLLVAIVMPVGAADPTPPAQPDCGQPMCNVPNPNCAEVDLGTIPPTVRQSCA